MGRRKQEDGHDDSNHGETLYSDNNTLNFAYGEIFRVQKPGGMLIIIADKGAKTGTAELAEKYLPMSGMKLVSPD